MTRVPCRACVDGMETEALGERLFDAALGSLDLVSVHLGDHFGWYRRLADHPATSVELAADTGVAERYAREWLEHQTVAGILEVEDPSLPAGERRFRLPADHVPVLADPATLDFFTPFARMIAAATVQLPALTEAYRTGGGVPWAAYGDLMRTAQADANRALFLSLLGPEWLASLPEVATALERGGRVADVGCGEGWSSIGIARAYPDAHVDGYDVDEASVVAARRHAEDHGVGDRVEFHHVDVAALAPEPRYDLVTALECIHDLSDPVAVLTAARAMRASGGTVLVMDERVPDAFGGVGDPVERLMYGLSLLVCLPDGLSHPGSVGTGTVMRSATLETYARGAGFGGVQVLPIEHDLFRFYRLT